MVHKFIEFVLLKDQIQSKFALVEKRVNYLFDVRLDLSGQEDNLRCWVKLEGKESDVHRAKEYIIGVCSPYSPVSSLEDDNNNSTHCTSQFDGSAKQTSSVNQINNNQSDRDTFNQQEISNSSTFGLERLNLGNSRLEHTSRCENLEAHSTQSTKRSECAYTANRSEGDRTGENEQLVQEIMVAPRANEAEKRVSEVTDESLRDFALKLGYSQAVISAALSKLGPSADKNALLNELLKAESSLKQLEEGSSNVSNKPHPAPEDASCLRPIVIDGSNVAMSHGTQRVFSCRGIGLAVDWFLHRNHRNIKVFVPMWRAKSSRPESPIVDQDVLKRLEADGILVWTPSRQVNSGRIIKCYDDRYIIKHASETDGVIVSNDNFKDLMSESHEWKKVIEQRLLMYTFVDDKFMPPDDPLGRHGPALSEFLKKGCGKLCPYERHCTYGNRCKFLHPERNPLKVEADLLSTCKEHLPPEVPYGQVKRRPLPPCPPEHQYTRPLPPPPLEYHKPLPLPPQEEFPRQMARVFPPTLRTGQAVGIGQRRSDPLPYRKELPPDVQMMQEKFERTLSEPLFQDQACGRVPPTQLMRRGSLPPQTYPPPYSPGPPEIMMRGSLPRIPNDNGMISRDWMYQGQGYPFTPHFPSNPPVSSQSPVYQSHQTTSLPRTNPWPGMQPFHYQYSPDNFAPGPFHHVPGFNGRAPYHGQGNSYFRSRAPPIIGGWCGDVTDNPKKGGTSSALEVEKLRIEAYEKLCEIFPDDVEKVLEILDKHSEETDVQKLTLYVLDEKDSGA